MMDVNERHLTMMTIRYLGLVIEKISAESAYSNRVGGRLNQVVTRLADAVEHIAQYDIEDLHLSARLQGLNQALTYLKTVVENEHELLGNHGLNAPEVAEIEELILAVQAHKRTDAVKRRGHWCS